MTYVYLFAVRRASGITDVEVSTPFANVASAISRAEQAYGQGGNGWVPIGVGEAEVWYPLHHWSERVEHVSFAVVPSTMEAWHIARIRGGDRLVAVGRMAVPAGR